MTADDKTFTPGDRVRVTAFDPAQPKSYLLNGRSGTVTKRANWGEAPRVKLDTYPIELGIDEVNLEHIA